MNPPPTIDSRLDELERFRLLVTGKDDANGWLGTLRSEVKLHRGIFAAVGTALAGSLIAILVLLDSAAEARGRERAEAEFLRQRVERDSARLESMSLQVELLKARLGLSPASPASGDEP